MEIPVFVEPLPTGFRATTTSPLPLSADGPTADAAVEALREQIAERLRAGGQLRTLTVTPVGQSPVGNGLAGNPLFDDWLRAVEDCRQEKDAAERAADAAGGQLRTLTALDVEVIRAAAKRMRENPMFEEFEKAIEEYRRENNTVPDPD